MKSIASILLTLAMVLGLLAGCESAPDSPKKQASAPTLTTEQAADVNTMASLLERYKTVTYAQLDYIGGMTIHKIYFQDENGNCCVTEEDSGYQVYATDGVFFSQGEGETEYSLFAGADGYVSDALFLVADSSFTAQTIDAAGNLVCEAVADIDQEYADFLSDHWPATTSDKMVTTMVFAPDDFRLLSIDFTIRRPDESESKIASGVMLYDLEVAHADAVQDYLDAEKYHVTTHLADGSTRVADIPVGKAFTWYCDEGYALYLDPDGKRPLPEDPEPMAGDLTLYCLQKQ